MADHVRSYIRSAYSWGMKSEHDYRSASPRRFRLAYNPAAGIPTEPKKVGTRWLDEDEFLRLYRWLECPDAPVHPPYTRAVRILMLTGQRVEEIARLHVDQWDAEGADHRLVEDQERQAARHSRPRTRGRTDRVRSSPTSTAGFSLRRRTRPSPSATARSTPSCGVSANASVIPVVTNRDLRRTWKTLAGKAGLSKEIRDRLQNHTLQDVSSKNYDRWKYMPEKREPR